MPRNAPYTRLQNTFKIFSSNLSGALQAEIRPWTTEKHSRFACKLLNLEQEVKTIWKTNESIRIDKFYYPSKVKKLVAIDEGNNKTIEVDKYIDFNVSNGILIEGIVGHGKSILLRHLHHNELNKGNTLPLFVELRNVSEPLKLEKYLYDLISKRLDLRCSKKLFNALLKINAISFFFDGFDEIPFKDRDLFIASIEDLYKKCLNPLFFVTSRPNVELGKATFFSVFRMVDLTNDDQPKFIKKLISSNAESLPLINNLNNGALKVRGLLNTPLILTLFAMVYKHKITIPDSYSAFYKTLFDTLISSHDGLKLGFARPTKSNLSADEIKQTLEYISLDIRQNDSFDFEKTSFKEACRKALRTCNLDSKLTDRFIEDLTQVTCLVQREGDRYRFLHDNILFYFAASCIKNNANDEQAKTFYTNRLEGNWRKWTYELEFLKNIDERRFNIYYYMPAIARLFGRKDFPDKLVFTEESALRIAKSYKVILNDDLHDKSNDKLSILIFMGAPACWVIPQLFPEVFDERKHEDLTHHIISGLVKYLNENKSKVDNLERVLRKVGVKIENKGIVRYVTGLDVVTTTLGIKKQFSDSINNTDLTHVKTLFNDLLMRTTVHDTERDLFA